MKKTLELTVTRKEKVTIDVEFPIYVKYGDSCVLSSRDNYRRLDENGTQTTIEIIERYDGGKEYEISSKPRIIIDSADDYSLGKGEYACTSEEFNKVLQEALEFVQSLVEVKQ